MLSAQLGLRIPAKSSEFDFVTVLITDTTFKVKYITICHLKNMKMLFLGVYGCISAMLSAQLGLKIPAKSNASDFVTLVITEITIKIKHIQICHSKR